MSKVVAVGRPHLLAELELEHLDPDASDSLTTMPPSRPQTPLDQRPAHLRALLPPGLAEQDVALRLARLKRQLDGATGGGAGGLTRGWEDATDGFAACVQPALFSLATWDY